MSASPTDDALIVALDFEGEFMSPLCGPLPSEDEKQQAYTVSSVRLRRTCFLFSSIPPFRIL